MSDNSKIDRVYTDPQSYDVIANATYQISVLWIADGDVYCGKHYRNGTPINPFRITLDLWRSQCTETTPEILQRSEDVPDDPLGLRTVTK